MTSRTLAAAALALVTACSTAGKGKELAPDEALFRSGLAHWDAASRLAADARALADAAARAAKEAQAVTEYGLAQADFRALPVQFPASARLDNAAYLDGRCDYEVGTISGERTRFESALTRLDAAAATFPSSRQRSSVLYFAGRAAFRLAEGDAAAASPSTDAIATAYATARARFAAALAAAASEPAPVYSDNASYYLGRCDFEIGYVRINPAEAGAAPPLPGSAAWNAADAAFTLAEAELAAVPATSSYLDNARYYLGRARYERPADVAAVRIAALQSAITAFDEVTAVPATVYRNGAFYWRARARYALAFRQGAGGVPLASGLDAALADLKAVEGAGAAPSANPSTYADNALAYVARAYVNLVPAACTAARTGDPSPASACAARAVLATRYALSSWIASTDVYLTAASCTCQ